MKHWRVVLALWIAMGTVGVAGTGCQSADGPGELLIDPLVAHDLGYSIEWSRQLGDPRNARLIYVELLGDRLVTLEDQNILSVIDPANGQLLWRHQVAPPHIELSRPVRDGNYVVICSQSRAWVRGLNTGSLETIIDLSHVSLGTPVIHDGLMIHGSPRGVLFAQEVGSGYQAWAYQLDMGVAAPPTLSQGLLFATDLGGNVHLFNPDDGTRMWRRRVAEPVRARPVVGDQLLYAASVDQSLYAMNLMNGRIAWRHYATAPLRTSPFLAGDVLLLNVPGEAIVALDPIDGSELWRSEQLLGGQALQRRGDFIDVYRQGELLRVDVRDGEVDRRTPMPRVDHVVAADGFGGDLYLVRSSGRILKVAPR